MFGCEVRDFLKDYGAYTCIEGNLLLEKSDNAYLCPLFIQKTVTKQ